MPSRINDPVLLEEMESGSGDDELSVIVRLSDPDRLPAGVRIVSRFGDIATVRVERSRLQELAESVTALEASRNLRPSFDPDTDEDDAIDETGTAIDPSLPPGTPLDYTRRPAGLEATGRGCIVAALDWGVDFAHPAFRHPDGSSRIISLWDQRGDQPIGPGNRWGYGRILTTADIDRALSGPNPYQLLDYDPADAGGKGGAHGTHVLDIAAGNGEGGGMSGVAPDADLVFVHLARTTDVLGVGNLGDSASVLEALDHVFSVAAGRPCVVNMSVGAHGGPHDGSTLVELGIDQAVSLLPGRAVTNSSGNYQKKKAHTVGRVPPGGEALLHFNVPPHDTNDSEIELFYGHIDRFAVEVLGPDGTALARVGPGETRAMEQGGRLIARVHHRMRHGTSGDHHVDLILKPDAPGGVWGLRLVGDTVNDGRYHAWIERDRGLQPTFVRRDIVTSSTTGTICNGRVSITCGCANPHRAPLSLAGFSSGGPTRDGRIKPELVAPGYRIRAARSTPRGMEPAPRYTLKSGTSMAAPHVAGTIALMFEAAGRPLEIYDTRALLFGSVDAAPFVERHELGPDLHRIGYGYLDIVAAERSARDYGRERDREAEPVREETEEIMETESWSPVDPLVADPPVPRSERLLQSLAASSWLRDHDELRRLAAGVLGHDLESPPFSLASGTGQLLGPVEPGDLLIRAAPIGGGSYVAVVVSERPEPWTSLVGRGIAVERAGPGAFVQVVEIPPGGGAPRTIGRRLTSPCGLVPRYQTILRAPPATTDRAEAAFGENVDDDDLAPEMTGLRCVFLDAHTARRPDGTTRTFSSGAILAIGAWNGSEADAVIDGFPVPKLVLAPYLEAIAGMRRYDVALAAERRAVLAAAEELRDWLAREATYRTHHDRWEAERHRFEVTLTRKGATYSGMWIRQMMYNRFDRLIVEWTHHYNTTLHPDTDLDPNIAKSMAYQESRMGTHGRHLMPPPSDWGSDDRHPVRSRFNIIQAIDSFGPQQWLMMKEMAPAIFTRHGLDALEARAVWLGMSRREYSGHPTFMRALREFFEARSAGANLMGTPGRDLHEDYAFWIRAGIRWLFEKYRRLAHPAWPDAVRAYNGGGAGATRYRAEVLARVGPTEPFRAEADALAADVAESESAESEASPAGAPAAAEDAPTLDNSAQLEWEALNRLPDSQGNQQLFYVVTGAPTSRAAVGDEGKAIFHLRARNTNSTYNHLGTVIKTRVLSVLPGRQFREVRPWNRMRGPELEDESSRVIRLAIDAATLQAAYNPDSPLTRLEVEYHWREHFDGSMRRYNRAGIDFMLVAPLELLLSRRRRLGPDVALNRPEHKDAFWVPFPGIEFTREMHQPATFQLQLSTSLRTETGSQQSTTTRTTRTTQQTSSTANTFSLQLGAEGSQGSTAKASLEVLELGVSELLKLSGSLGFSRTTTDTTSTSVAREFARTLVQSRSYAETFSTTATLTMPVLPPETPVPRGTGTHPGPTSVPGYGGVGIYLYPMVGYFEVPYVRFADVNALGQATRRVEGTVAVPFITAWRLFSRAD